MIPISIEVTNFRGIPYANIDLSDITIAAVCGKNGAGKSSAFTLAPRFALFGDVIDGVPMDKLVRTGTQEMAVTFKFEHQGSIYRTIRTRSTKGSGKSTLEFQQQVNGRWEGRSAEKIKDTEAKIRELLNLDDETFTASSMIMQGKANEFTAKTAGKRKEILQQILGLSIYEKLQEQARVKAAALNIEIEKMKSKLADLELKLGEKATKDELLADHERQLSETTTQLGESETALKLLQTKIADLQVKATRVIDLVKQSVQLDEGISALVTERSGLQAKLDVAEKIIRNEDEIIAKSAEALVLQEKITVLKTKEPQLEKILTEQTRIRADLAKIDSDAAPIVGQITALVKLIANKQILDEAAAEFKTKSLELEQLDLLQKQDQEKLTAHMIASEVANSARNQFENKKKALDEKIKVFTSKTTMLADSNCIDVTIAACHFLVDAQEAKKDLILAEVELSELDPLECQVLENACQQILNERTALNYDQLAYAKLKDRVNQLRPLSEQAAQLESKVELLKSLEAQSKRFEENKSTFNVRLSVLIEDEFCLAAELMGLATLQSELVEIMKWANLKDQLNAQREVKKSASERIAAIDQDVLTKTGRKNAIDVESSVLTLESLDLETKKALLLEYESQIRAARERQGILQTRIGGLKTEIAAFETAGAERKRISKEMEPKAMEWTRYQTLIRAFGKDGIPALIIENAVPALEKIANEILGQMSKGKHYLRFETQRELKDGKGLAETLDIMIGDWVEERPYETFSGGEQLRIDYAIRFALAELLAIRAGNEVEWLTVDEGLGSQDTEHRMLVLDAIKSVAHRFKKVLLITHIEEAQAVFEQRIYFNPDDEGVNVKVA